MGVLYYLRSSAENTRAVFGLLHHMIDNVHWCTFGGTFMRGHGTCRGVGCLRHCAATPRQRIRHATQNEAFNHFKTTLQRQQWQTRGSWMANILFPIAMYLMNKNMRGSANLWTPVR